MSFHRYIVPPPLVLAVHPAPPPKPQPEVKKDKDGKPIVEAKKDKDGKPIPPVKDGEKAKPADDKDGVKVKDKDDKDSPDSPKSDAAEPPTPAPGEDAKEEEGKAAKGDKVGEAKVEDEVGKGEDKRQPADDKKDSPDQKDKTGEKVKDESNKKDEGNDVEDKKDKGKDEKEKEQEPEVPPPPLNLAGPAPARPLRARLDLDPSQPYPPVHVDPRGAYHKYAKAVQGEMIYLDVTKDGWLAEQWRERPEREALAELTGVAERDRQREMSKVVEAEMTGVRKVPETAEEILKDLWNDLAKAPSNEMPVGDFWAKYDWSTVDARVHLATAPKRPKPVEEEPAKGDTKAKDKKEIKAGDSGSKAQDKETKAAESASSKEADKDEKKDDKDSTSAEQKDAPEKKDEPVVVPPWTREGFEEVLATVGIQCNYNSEKPLPKNYWEASGSYLLLAHDHFLLRREDWLEWKPELNAHKFEVLVTSSHDRVFGSMVRAQQAEERKKKEEEYKKRKMKEYKERKAREAKEKAEGNDDDKSKDKDDKKKDKEGGDKKEGDKAKDKVDKVKDGEKDKPTDKKVGEIRADTPDTDISNVKVRNGEPVKPAEDSGEPVAGVMKDGKAIVAVPAKEQDKAANLDEKHEREPEIVAPAKEPKDVEAPENAKAVKDAKEPKEPKDNKDAKGDGRDKGKDGDKGKEEKEKEQKDKEKDGKKPPALRAGGPPDPQRDAALLAQMLADPASAKLGMDELKAAFQALELAGKAGMVPMPPMPGMSLGSGNDMPPIPQSAKKDPNQPLIWVWHERCEKWRWTNFVAGVHNVGPGGWEERDWRMFADDRGCEEYEDEEIEAEIEEVDLHDWSC